MHIFHFCILCYREVSISAVIIIKMKYRNKLNLELGFQVVVL